MAGGTRDGVTWAADLSGWEAEWSGLCRERGAEIGFGRTGMALVFLAVLAAGVVPPVLGWGSGPAVAVMVVLMAGAFASAVWSLVHFSRAASILWEMKRRGEEAIGDACGVPGLAIPCFDGMVADGPFPRNGAHAFDVYARGPGGGLVIVCDGGRVGVIPDDGRSLPRAVRSGDGPSMPSSLAAMLATHAGTIHDAEVARHLRSAVEAARRLEEHAHATGDPADQDRVRRIDVRYGEQVGLLLDRWDGLEDHGYPAVLDLYRERTVDALDLFADVLRREWEEATRHGTLLLAAHADAITRLARMDGIAPGAH